MLALVAVPHYVDGLSSLVLFTKFCVFIFSACLMMAEWRPKMAAPRFAFDFGFQEREGEIMLYVRAGT